MSAKDIRISCLEKQIESAKKKRTIFFILFIIAFAYTVLTVPILWTWVYSTIGLMMLPVFLFGAYGYHEEIIKLQDKIERIAESKILIV